ncbi:MAG: polysaccharide biosynthesis tyrosine autokinase [Planctomycetes bacterium]|nr:polysaccharide biosynthesis tyrosine autokinase [Planctomycetota bacterium]
MTANPLTPMTMGGGAVSTVHVPSTAPSRFTPLDPFRVLRQYARLLILAAVVGVALGLGIYFLLLRHAPEFTSTAQILVTPPPTRPEDMPDPFAVRGDLGTMIQNQLVMIRSDDLLQEALKRDVVRQTKWFSSFEDVRGRTLNLRENLSAFQLRGTTIIAVTLTGRHKADLQNILDTIVDIYLTQTRLREDLRGGDIRRVFLEERNRADIEIARIQEQLKQFRSENDLSSVFASNNDAAITYENLARQRPNVEQAAMQARDMYQSLLQAQREGRINASPADTAAAQADPSVAGRDERLRTMRESRKFMLNHLGERHNTIRDLDEQIAIVEQERGRELDRILRARQAVQLEESKKALDAIESQLASFQAKFDEARTRMRDLTQKLEEAKRIETLVDTSTKRRERYDDLLNNLRIKSTRPDSLGVTRQLSATQPEMTSPKLGGILSMSTMIVMGITFFLVFLKELLDQRIKSPADIRLLPGAVLLGVLPDAGEDPSGPTKVERVVAAHPMGLLAESIRQIRTVLLSKADPRGYKTLMIVGATPESGVSAITSNLAISLALNQREVLVIDANYRRPNQHRLFNTPNRPGLIEVLNGSATAEEALFHNKDLNVDVLPAGNTPDAPPELLEGTAFRNLLTEFERRYDFILIDAPPILVAADSLLLAKRVDATVVVARAMVDKRGIVARLLRQLDGHRAETLGLVLNGVRASVGGYFRENYQSFYRYRKASIDAAARKASMDRGASRDESRDLKPDEI